MGEVIHLRDVTPVGRLDEIEDAVYEAVDFMCMKVGELLFEAREIDPPGFKDWVDKRMPFGIDKAKRLIAIHLAYQELPADVRDQLPRPWQALYSLRRWTGGRLQDAIADGEVGPDTTVADALKIAKKWSKDTKGDSEPITARYGRADNVAGKLMVFPANELNPDVARALGLWLERSEPDPS